jgi:hypothetical protein
MPEPNQYGEPNIGVDDNGNFVALKEIKPGERINLKDAGPLCANFCGVDFGTVLHLKYKCHACGLELGSFDVWLITSEDNLRTYSVCYAHYKDWQRGSLRIPAHIFRGEDEPKPLIVEENND